MESSKESNSNKPYYHIITGSTSGVGLLMTQELIQQGHHVIMTARSIERANDAKIKILKHLHNKENNLMIGPDSLIIMILDLNSMKSVLDLAKKIIHSNYKIRSILHCAAIFYNATSKHRMMNDAGCESTYSVNYVGPYLLVELLLDYFEKQYKNDNQRINIISLSTSGIFHEQMGVTKKYYLGFKSNEIGYQKPTDDFNGYTAYINSKICLAMWLNTVAEHEKTKGIDTIVLCPRLISGTKLYKHQTDAAFSFMKQIKSLNPSMREKKKNLKRQIIQFLNGDISSFSGSIHSNLYPTLTLKDIGFNDVKKIQDEISINTKLLIKKMYENSNIM